MQTRNRKPSLKAREMTEIEPAVPSPPATQSKTKPDHRANPRKSQFTLEKVVEMISNLDKFAENSRQIWKDKLIILAIYAQPNYEEYNDNTCEEAYERLKHFDMGKLLRDVDNVIDLVEKKIKNRSSNDDKPIAPETKKQYYNAVVKLLGKHKIEVKADIKQKYNDKIVEKGVENDDIRDENREYPVLKEHPDFTWEVAKEKFMNYIDTNRLNNTGAGKERLRWAVMLGLYMLQEAPRRAKDYQLLQYYDKKPKDTDMHMKNILVMEKKKATLYIDDYKTRRRKGKDALDRFEAELEPKLFSLMKDYVKFFDIKNGDYVFHPLEQIKTRALTPKGYSNALERAMFKIFGIEGLTGVNVLRHVFQTWIRRHANEFNDKQIKRTFFAFGDSPYVPQGFRYAMTNPQNRGKEAEVVQQELLEKQKAKDMAQDEAQSQGSVGDGEEQPEIAHISNDDVIIENVVSAIRVFLKRVLEKN